MNHDEDISPPMWIKGPNCTDNFQVRPFFYEGLEYFSCEQAYQANKYPPGQWREKVRLVKPRKDQSDEDHGCECWAAGNDRRAVLRPDWDLVKVRIMYEVNAAKYAQHADLVRELLATEHANITGGASTGWRVGGMEHGWASWNGLIQMRIREELTPPDQRRPGVLDALRAQFEAYEASVNVSSKTAAAAAAAAAMVVVAAAEAAT
jgi:predicted NAD-dependent protein-ADP-ribosyltransferase YbiA (DUF1768 family)